MNYMDKQWVANALEKVYQTPEYRSRIMIEYYRTQPLPFTKGKNQFISIYFGRQMVGEVFRREPLEPHLTVVVSYPDMDISWNEVPTGEIKVDRETFKTLDDPEEFKKAQDLLPQRNTLIKNYYEILSELLASGWLVNDNRNDLPRQRELAKEIDSLLNKIMEPLLKWFYPQTGKELMNWVRSKE